MENIHKGDKSRETKKAPDFLSNKYNIAYKIFLHIHIKNFINPIIFMQKVNWGEY